MYVDLLTLYSLAIGTLVVGAMMTFWEHRTNPKRSLQLRILAAGFATLALGCSAVLLRKHLPAVTGSALSNLTILCGYLLVYAGVASLAGRSVRRLSVAMISGMALIWVVGGSAWHDLTWNYVSSIPIAVVSALTAREVLRNDALRSLPSRPIVALITGLHSAFYFGRAFFLPWLVAHYGASVQSIASKFTLYEGVLYSVALPMILLKLVREEIHGQLLHESTTDYLTRLGNRRWFFDEGASLIAAKRHTSLSVLAFDLDHFKSINDLHGHQAGDDVLKSFAETARRVLGPNVLIARIGGEEFAALIEGRDAQQAQSVGETIAQSFTSRVSTTISSINITATVSVGLAHYDRETPSLKDALARADRALYKAKALGGNRLVRL